MALVLPLLIIFSLAATFLFWVSWLVSGHSGLIALTYEIVLFCQSLMVQCVESLEILKISFLWLGGAVLMTGLFSAVVKGVWGLVKTRRAIRRLPALKRAGSIVLIDDKGSRAAFTHGLIRPRVYLSRGLLIALDHDELKGVFLHELHHKRRYDPLRFFFITFVKDAFFYLPVARYLAAYVRTKSEGAADDAAVSNMLEPYSLAGALLKVARSNSLKIVSASASITGTAASGSVEARIKRLIHGTGLLPDGPGARSVCVSILVAGLILLSLVLPLKTGALGLLKDCSTDHCTLHADRLGSECKAHCEVHDHRS
jgi:beta-lactamase regulating signal transducer with metallopeptidase domain